MRKLTGSLIALTITLALNGQSNAVDEMFDKYSEKEGFTVVSISSKMLGMFASDDKKEAGEIINRLKSIQILSVEDSLLNRTINFYTELGKKLNYSDYEDLMVVKEGQDITKFLIRQKGEVITELLIITGGPGGNSLISIKGDLNLKTISELSKDVGIDELKSLDEMEKKQKK
jgi:hypothetical protein